MEDPKPDWEISELYKKAWQILKKNKVIWIFGLASGLGLGSFNSRFSSNNFNAKDLQNIQNIFKSPENATQSAKLSQVLGTSTSSFGTSTQQIFSHIPTYIYIVLGLELLIAVVVGVIISVIYRAWIQGALISSIQIALQDKTPTIKESSQKAFPSIKPLIWLQLVPSLILMVTFFAVTGVLVLLIIFASLPIKIIAAIIAFAAFFVFLYFLIYLSLSQIWAQRRVVIDNIGAKEALISSYKLARKKNWAMIILGLVNNILGWIVVGLPILIVAGIVIAGVFAVIHLGNTALIPAIILGVILGIAVGLFILISSGLITSFKAIVWTIAYNKIKGKFNG